ncbi:hypothetical protein [Streptomyces sp. NPDC088115]|uniref:hypothetical protein n=1 Tax=Streptomyces sp. NPDC088115 TaxID=3365824 RepID=UPI0038215CB0
MPSSSWSRSGERPAPITRPAPRCRAIWTASRPALPVAPRTRTELPGRSETRERSATHEDMPGFIAAATSAGSVPDGSTTARRRSATAFSAMVPGAVSEATK